MIQVNRIYLIFNRLVTKKFLVDTSDFISLTRDCFNRKDKFFIRQEVVKIATFACFVLIKKLLL